MTEGQETAEDLARRTRAYLCTLAGSGRPITYQALAKALALKPPNTIQQLTDALEGLIYEDAAAGRPLIAALVISKARGGLPALGFFECAQQAGCFSGPPTGPEADRFHATEFGNSDSYWCAVNPRPA